MVTPFGKKVTGVHGDRAPERVDFDVLWRRAIEPALRELGYRAIRASEDNGPLILVEMIERLTDADLVVADLSIQNGNVYYEVGVRHAAEKHRCVLIAAEWAQPMFDLAQVRQCRYPLPSGTLTARDYTRVRAAVRAGVKKYANAPSPVHLIEKAARRRPAEHLMEDLERFQERLAKLEPLSGTGRERALRVLVKEYCGRGGDATVVRAIGVELLFAVRDGLGWKDALALIQGFPNELRSLAVVREQKQLAISKTGKHAAAIRALETLIAELGDTSERRGLLGGRFKDLYRATKGRARARHLDLAIEHYERGMRLDLNDYYPSSNLARLYRARGAPDDAQRARAVVQVAIAACERARERKSEDEWLRRSLLGAFFDAGDVRRASELAAEVLRERPASWKRDTMLADLHLSSEQQEEPARGALKAVIAGLEAP
jgi:tetratricopeptide (TPR) repeat protein